MITDVEHGSLPPAKDEANRLASVCPTCKEGALLCIRNPVTLELQELDTCSLCGQQVRYTDIEDMRRKDWASAK